MASGGRDAGPDADANGSAPGGGQHPPARPYFQLNQLNLHARQLSAEAVDIRGSVIFMDPYARPRFQPRYRRPDVDDQALLETPPPEDVSHYFSEADLARVIEEKYLSYVANSCDENSNWRRLARKLKLDPPSVTRLEQNYGDNVREFIYQLLLTWKRRHPEVRVHDLIKLLSDSKLQKPALELKKYFSSIHWTD